MNRHRLTDRQWEAIEPLLPGGEGKRGRPGIDNRMAVEGIIWVLRTGAPWRDLPERFGKWDTVYQRFRRWSRDGLFERIFEITKGDLDLRSVQVDGSYVKVHQHGAGAPKGAARQTNHDSDKRSGEAGAG